MFVEDNNSFKEDYSNEIMVAKRVINFHSYACNELYNPLYSRETIELEGGYK